MPRQRTEAILAYRRKRKFTRTPEPAGRVTADSPRDAGSFPTSEPLLPAPGSALPRHGNWLHEIKLDGVRVLAERHGDRVRLVSRRGNDLAARFPEVVEPLRRASPDRFVLDGELCVHDPQGRSRFQLIQPRIHVGSPAAVAMLARSSPATLHVFDALFVGDRDLRLLPIEERKQAARAVVPPDDDRLRYLDHVVGRGPEFLALACEKGLEGVVAKRAGSRYSSGRTRDWIKVKCGGRAAFVIVGFTRYESTAPREIGGLLLATYRDGDLVLAGGVGTGFNRATRRALHRRLVPLRRTSPPFRDSRDPGGARHPARKPSEVVFVEPEVVCECRYAEFTADLKVRHASFVGLVDRDPRSCTLPEEALREEARASETPPAPKRPPRQVQVTNLDKVFWPGEGITKGELVEYYRAIAPVLIPHLAGRPMVLRRLPDGLEGEAFYQKNAGPETPSWIRKVPIHSRESDRDVAYIVVDDAETLIHCIQIGCISLSPWSSRVASLENPDFVILDLDPGDECTFDQVVDLAHVVRGILEEAGLRAYPKTSGATGMHVQVPLEPVYSYADTRALAEVVARIAAARRPDLATLHRTLRTRPKDRTYLDYLQNAIGKTVVGPYSVREVPGAPVSAPLRWPEVARGLDPSDFPMRTFPRRVDRVGDLWRPMLEDRQRLESAVERLAGLWGRPSGDSGTDARGVRHGRAGPRRSTRASRPGRPAGGPRPRGKGSSGPA